MENNTVTQIAALALQGAEIKTVGDTPFALVPEGYTAELLERHLPAPTRKRGNTRVQDQTGFLAVFKRHQTADSTVIYADRHAAVFRAVFNDDTAEQAGWKDHTVTYACPKSNEWYVWTKNDGVKMSQEQFARFIEQNLVDIYEPAAAHMLEISRELVAKKSANFSSSIRLSNGSHQFHYDEDIKGSTKSGNLEVPETFVIGLPVFLNGDAYKIEARLRYRIKEQQLEMWYELVRPHDVYEDAFNAVHAAIAEATGREIVNAEI
jgi:uncharacterized protein YfdQ (DUF2303 family)